MNRNMVHIFHITTSMFKTNTVKEALVAKHTAPDKSDAVFFEHVKIIIFVVFRRFCFDVSPFIIPV